MHNFKPWAKVKIPFLQNPLLCSSHRKLAQPVPSFTAQKLHWTQHSLPGEWKRRGLQMGLFQNAGVKLRDSLAQFQHKESLVRKERIQVQAQTLQTALQLTNTQILHCPMGPAAACWNGIISPVLSHALMFPHAERSWEWDYTARHREMKQQLRMCIKCSDLFCSLILCTLNKTKLQGQQVSF